MKIGAALLVTVLLAQQAAGAQANRAPLVSRTALDAALQSGAARRAANLKRIRQVLEKAADRAAEAARLSERLDLLDDETVERLANRSDEVARQQGMGKGTKVVVTVLLTLIILALVASALAPESS